MDRDKLGKFISVQRKNKGFTQQKLAEELNISNKTISKWETGEGYPDITIVPRLAEVLEVTPNELLSCESDNKKVNGKLVEDDAERNKYLANKIALRFQNLCIISCAVGLLGIIFYFALWYQYKNTISLIIGSSLGILSGCIFLIGYNTLRGNIIKISGIDRKKILSRVRKSSEECVYIWLMYLWIFIDFSIAKFGGEWFYKYQTIRYSFEGFTYGCAAICIYSRLKKQMVHY